MKAARDIDDVLLANAKALTPRQRIGLPRLIKKRSSHD